VPRAPKLELLWWEGCPSSERALIELREAAGELGFDTPAIGMREIRTDEEAAATGFIGSPTILVDGRDPLAADGERARLPRLPPARRPRLANSRSRRSASDAERRRARG
jgi:hypothetical protein